MNIKIVRRGCVKDPSAKGLVKTVFNEGAKQGSLSYVDTELENTQNKTVEGLVQGTSVLRKLVGLGSLEAATGHRDNQKLTAIPGETR